MQSTSLGHIILGKFNVKQNIDNLMQINPINNVQTLMPSNKDENEKLRNALTKFWELEEVVKCETRKPLNAEQQMVEDIFAKTHYRQANGRYVVTIPIKPGHITLGSSRNMAKMQFLQLERKFKINPDLKEKYVHYMRENIQNNYMRPAADPNASALCYWIPHHAVTKKFRVVLNASAKTSNGESLNSIQMNGPKLQYDSQLQTMRFRRHKHAVATDIAKMFNQVDLNPKQWDLHRLFWRENENEPLKDYVMTVVIFGEKSSSYNAVRAMNQNANNYARQFPDAASTILKSFYIDDGIFGCDTVHQLKILCKEVEFVLAQGNFKLKGWASNTKEVEDYLNAHAPGNVSIGEKGDEKILGLQWLKAADELGIVV